MSFKLSLLKSVIQCNNRESNSSLGASLPYCKLVFLSNILEMMFAYVPTHILNNCDSLPPHQDRYCVYNPSPVTLRQLVDFGQTATEEESFDFVKKEVPVRVANIMKEINLLPANLLQMPSVVVIQVGDDAYF